MVLGFRHLKFLIDDISLPPFVSKLMVKLGESLKQRILADVFLAILHEGDIPPS